MLEQTAEGGSHREMSTDYYFYVESLQMGLWNRPVDLADATHARRNLGEFAWLKGSSPACGLFFGERAVFHFRAGRPPVTEESTLFRHYSYMSENDLKALRPAWIPYAELMVDIWDEPALTIRGLVTARDASFFSDGKAPFPAAELQASGWSESELARLREGHLTDQPIDRDTGLGRYELDASLPTALLSVTWTDSINGYLDPRRAEAFRSLRRYGTDAGLRVISLYA